jgi:hypothetical protein
MGSILTKEQILGAQDIQFAEVDIPECGGSARVKSMNGFEREQYFKLVREGQFPLSVILCIICQVDEHGVRLFTLSDAALLAEKNGTMLDRIAMAALTLNRMTVEAIEETRKN